MRIGGIGQEKHTVLLGFPFKEVLAQEDMGTDGIDLICRFLSYQLFRMRSPGPHSCFCQLT